MASRSAGRTLLCVCNYPANTGYAWDFIESLYSQIAGRLAASGVRTLVAYPRIDEPPRTLIGSAAQAVALDATLRTEASIRDTLAFVQREGVDTIYLTDQPARAWAYARLRRAGVRRIVVHDHSSGARSTPTGLKRAGKWLLARTPGIVADVVIAVSDYVAERHVRSGVMPRGRIVRVWNGTVVPPPPSGHPLHDALGVPHARPIVACACRAAPEKGVPVLLKAFDLMLEAWPEPTRPLLVYMGDGPDAAQIAQVREGLGSAGDIMLTGYRRDAGALVAGATVCAMPSVWQDALPLAVMQPMALGKPVVASAVGGIPEMIVDGETGLLVPPSDVPALAAALKRLLLDPTLAARLGEQARARVARLFTPEEQIDRLTAIAGEGLAPRR
jgi:glycosyltransferase involved in cell wall biosynthesis